MSPPAAQIVSNHIQGSQRKYKVSFTQSLPASQLAQSRQVIRASST